jgi:hypothetical protein
VRGVSQQIQFFFGVIQAHIRSSFRLVKKPSSSQLPELV